MVARNTVTTGPIVWRSTIYERWGGGGGVCQIENTLDLSEERDVSQTRATVGRKKGWRFVTSQDG